MDKQKIKQQKRDRRKGRIRVKISGSKECPRLSVFRSNKAIYLQLIDDEKGKTLASAQTVEIKSSFAKATEDKDKKISLCFELGKLIAEKAIKKKIKKIVFDRGGHKYHGNVKAIADGAREGGIEF